MATYSTPGLGNSQPILNGLHTYFVSIHSTRKIKTKKEKKKKAKNEMRKGEKFVSSGLKQVGPILSKS